MKLRVGDVNLSTSYRLKTINIKFYRHHFLLNNYHITISVRTELLIIQVCELSKNNTDGRKLLIIYTEIGQICRFIIFKIFIIFLLKLVSIKDSV